MSPATTCSFTGHRSLRPAQLSAIKSAIEQQLHRAIQDGYTQFICGMAKGADLLFASVIASLKKRYTIVLEAALPYPDRMNTPDPLFRELIAQCDRVVCHSPVYHPGCYHLRNCYMVENSSRIIALYNGQLQGGTAFTVRYAQERGLDVRIITAEE